tara:strand:- start:7111 stop:8424 length:1314 start_codon:yes stop_codon:yes gene_type:complete
LFNIDKNIITERYQNLFSALGSIFIGICIPLVASSPSAMGVSAFLGFICILLLPGRKILFFSILSGFSKPLGLVVIFLFLAWLPAVFDSVDIVKSLGVWLRILGFIIVATTFYFFLLSSNLRRRLVLNSLLIVSLVSSFVGLISIHIYSPILSIYRLDSVDYINATQTLKYYGSVEGCMSIIVLWAGFKLSGIWRALAILKVSLGIILIFSVDSDAGLLALISGIVCGILVIFESKIFSKRISGLSISLIFILAIILYSILLANLPSTPNLADHQGQLFTGEFSSSISPNILDTHRQHIWAFSLDQALKSPLIGYGIDVSNYLPGAQVIVAQFNQAFIPGHPHSWFLEVFLETGALGLFALVTSLFVLLWCWHKVGQSKVYDVSAGISIFAAFWSSSMINFSIWSSWWQGMFLIITAIVLAFSSNGKQNQHRTWQEK